MKSLNANAIKRKVQMEAQAAKAEIAYACFVYLTPRLVREVEAMVLYALSMHGYGKKRLHDVHGWFKTVCDLPEVFGKRITTADCMKHMRDKYGIDFDEINIQMPTYEEYMEDNT